MTTRLRLRRLAGNVGILAVTALRHAQDDPALLAVQTARRLPAARRRDLSRAIVGTSRRLAPHTLPTAQALAAFLDDRPDQARGMIASTMPRGRLEARVRDELAVHLGLAAPGGPVTRARAAWQRGDLASAVAELDAAEGVGARHLRERLASERATMQPGTTVPLPAVRSRGPSSVPPRASEAASGVDRESAGGHHRPLHLLTNSLPHTSSGYTVRSHAILLAQRHAGMAPAAATRVGYPVVIGLPLARAVDEVDGIEYHRLLPPRPARTPQGRLEQTAEGLAGLARRTGANVLHTTTHFPNALVAQAVSRATGLPWVYEVRGQLEKTWVASRPPTERAAALASERYRLARARETEMCLAAGHVAVLSQSIHDDLASRGVPRERMTVVPNGVEEALLSAQLTSRQARERLGLDTAGFWVGSVSSLVDYEGLDTLIRAVAALRRAGTDIRCAIAGDGVARPALAALCEELGMGRSVVLPGRVPREVAPLWHQALDVFCVPRRDTDVCRTVTPLKPVEAMAVGRPVIVSDLPALAELVDAPGAGLLVTAEATVALADTIERMRADVSLREQLARAGRQFAATRTWSALAHRYEQIYAGVRQHDGIEPPVATDATGGRS